MSEYVKQFTRHKDTVDVVDRMAEEIIMKVKKVSKDMRENAAIETENIQMSNK
ncbi:MAG: hypothetical protein ACUVUQ_11025 [Thermodesulfovibrionales bacterium]